MSNTRVLTSKAGSQIKTTSRRRAGLLGTSALTAAVLAAAWAAPASALPVDGQVLGGQADIGYANREVTVDQHTDRAIIEWRELNIGADETMRVNQPAPTSTLYNTTRQADVSRVLGRLVANGQIIIHNPNGVVIGAGADIDVQSIVATSIGVDHDRFMTDGTLIFDQPGSPTAVVSNAGTITVGDGGLAALVAPGVENAGIIQAEMGTVALAAGNAVTLDFYGDNLIQIAVTEPTQETPVNAEGQELAALISHTGAIHADGGTVLMTAESVAGVVDSAINLDGYVQARSIGAFGGQVALVSESGAVEVAGTIDVTGDDAGEVGGTAHLLGAQVALADGGSIDASGQAGGGTVLIGGAYTGGDLAAGSAVSYDRAGSVTTVIADRDFVTDGYIPTSDITYFDAGATVDAGAPAGDGGSVIVWGTDEVYFHGAIDTMGGANGFVEVSTHGTGVIDGTAATGHFLVDPGDVCVVTASTSGCAAGAAELAASTIVTVLNGGGLFVLSTDVYGTTNSGTGRVDFGGGGNLTVNNNTGTIGTFRIHAADEINTQQVGFGSNGDTGTNFEWYAGSSATASPQSTADIVLFGQNFVTGGGDVLFDAADDISIGDPLQTGGGNATLIARGGDGEATVIFTTSDARIETAGGTATIQTDNVQINGDATSNPLINAGTGTVEILTTTAGRSIDLGTDDPDSLGLTAAELDLIAAETLRIGNADSGTITISDQIQLTNVGTLALETAGAVEDGTAGEQADLTVTNLVIRSGTGITGLDTAVTNLAFANIDGAVDLGNTGALTIAALDGLTTSSNNGTTTTITTASPLTFAVNLTSTGTITATAGESGTADTDNITVSANVTVQSTGSGVTLQAGDDVILGAGATVSANGTLTVTAGHNDIDGDGGLTMDGTATLTGSSIDLAAVDSIALGALTAAGGTVSIVSGTGAITDANDPPDGTINVTASSLSLTAATGIGGTGTTATLETQVSNLEAVTTSGGIFIDNTGDLAIGGVTGSLSGVRVETSGDIALTNAGRIDITVAGDRVVGPGAISLTANGATADIVTGSDAVIPNATVQSSGGTVTLRAGRDLLLGDPAGAGTLGNVFGGGSVVLDAGRDIIVDTGTFVQASGAGTITANAGRNISVLDTSGPFAGAEIRTEGGDITLTTGAGGVFTANNGASPAVQTTVSGGNGNITISADAVDIRNSILAGTGIVTLQTVTNGQLINLGGADAAGTLGLTDTELDLITAGILRIGSATAGSITVTSAISPANTNTLSLITGSSIVDGNATGTDVQVSNLALKAVSGIGVTDALELGVGTVAAANSTSGSIRLLQLSGLGDLTVGAVDGVVGVSNQATSGLSQTQVRTENANLIVNSAVSSAQDPLLLAAGGNSLLDNNAAISTAAGFGIDLQASSMALEGGTVTAGSNGRVRVIPLFAGQAIDLGSTSDAGAGLELSDAELDTITAGVLQIGRSGIGDITVTDQIAPANVSTLDLRTSGAVLDGHTGTDIIIDSLVFRTGAGFGTAGDAVGINVNTLAFANTGGVVNLSNIGSLTIDAVDGLATSSNTGTTTTIRTLGSGTLTFAVDTSSSGDATFTAPTITVDNGVDVGVTAGALAFNGTTVNLDGNLTASGGISGTATTVNVVGDTGGAEIQDGVDVAASGATVNVGDGTFAGGIVIDKALTMLGDGFSTTTTVTVADGTAGMTVTAGGVTIDGFLFTGDGTPVDATGVLVDGSGGALTGVLIGDSSDADALGNRFAGLTTGLLATGGGTANAVGVEIAQGNVFEDNVDGMVFNGAGVDIDGDTLNNTVFGTHSGNYIELAGGAEFLPGQPTIIDATGVSFEGLDLTVAANALTVESRIVHYLDDGTLGLIDFGAVAVNAGSSLQLAVNAAGFIGGTQTVTVGAGTFGGSVEVWVDDLTLAGQGAATIIDTDAVDAFANNGDADNGFQVAAISALSGGGDVSGVTIDGFSFTGTGGTIGVELGETGVSVASGATVQNSSFTDLLDGIVANNVTGTTTISNVAMTGIAQQGIRFDPVLAADDTILIENSTIAGVVDAVRFSSALTGADVTITGNTIEGGGDGIEFAGAIGNGSDVTIAENLRIEGLGTFIDEDLLSDGIVFRGAVSGTTTSILIDDNMLIRGADRGINFASSGTGGPATVTDASVTISRNDEIRGTEIDAILFNADLTNATIVIGGTSDADGNGLIIGGDEGLDIENVLGGSFTVANNTRIAGGLNALEFEGSVSNGAEVTILGNTTIQGDDNGVIFLDTVSNGAVTIADNTTIQGLGVDGISIFGATDSTVVIAGNAEIFGDGFDGIFVNTGLTNTDFTVGTATATVGGVATTFGGNGQIVGAENGVNVADISGGTFTVANNTLIQGNTGDGINAEDIVDNAQVAVVGNTEIRGGDGGGVNGADGISIVSADSSTIAIAGNAGIFGDGFDGIFVANSLTDTVFTVGTATATVGGVATTFGGNGQIVGADDGLNIGAITGGAFTVADNGTIQGVAGSGIEFDDAVSNAAALAVVGNTEIRGGEEGVEFDTTVTSSTVTIAGNSAITADTTDGILFADAVTDSTVVIGTATVTVDGTPTGFGGNTIAAAANGINVAGAVAGTTTLEITDNQIGTDAARVGGDGIAFANGILDTASVTIGGTNQVFAADRAIEVVNLQSPSTLTIGGGTYSGVNGALRVDNTTVNSTNQGRVVIENAPVFTATDGGATVAAFLTDADGPGIELDLTNSGATFSGGDVGLFLDGPGIDLAGAFTLGGFDYLGTLGGSVFEDNATFFVSLGDGAEFEAGVPNLLFAGDARFITTGTLDTLGSALVNPDGSIADLATFLAVEDGIFHYLDADQRGQFWFGQTTAVAPSSLQQAVNIAGLFGLATVDAVNGVTYGGSVEVWVDNLTINGNGTTIDTDAVDTFANNGDTDNGLQVAAISGLSGGGDVSGVTIDGFSFAGTGATVGIELGEAGVSTADGATIRNNSFNGVLDGIVANAVTGTTTIADVAMTDVAQRGIAFLGALGADDTVLIQNSTIGSIGDSVHFAGTLDDATVTIADTTIASTAGDGIRFANTITGGTVAITNNTVSGGGDGIDVNGIAGDAAVTLAGNTVTFGSAPANAVAGPLGPSDWNAGIRLSNVTSTEAVQITGGSITGLLEGGVHLGEIGVLIDNSATPAGGGNGTVLIDGTLIDDFSVAGIYVETSQIGTPTDSFGDNNGIVLGLNNGVVIASTAVDAAGLWINGPETFLADPASPALGDVQPDVTLNDTTFDLTFSVDLPDPDATGPGRAAGNFIYFENFALWNADAAAPFLVDATDVTWTSTIDGVTTTIEAGPDERYTRAEITTIGARIRDNADGFDVGLVFLEPEVLPFLPFFNLPTFGIGPATPGDAAYRGGELTAQLPDIFGENFSVGQLASEPGTDGDLGGLEPAAGGETDGAAEDDCVETFFTDFWATEAACETVPGDQAALLP